MAVPEQVTTQPDKPSTPPPSPYYLAALDVARILADLATKDGGK